MKNHLVRSSMARAHLVVNADGAYFTMFQVIAGGVHKEDDETVGIALSPDHKRLYAGFKGNGFIFEFTRVDGLAFE